MEEEYMDPLGRDFWWHNAIDGLRDCKGIVEDAKFCLQLAQMLQEAEESGAIEIAGGDSQPSLTMWHIKNVDKYTEVCKKHGFKYEDFRLVEVGSTSE